MPPNPITHNTLFYGDNLSILREHMHDYRGLRRPGMRRKK